jgi:chromosome segregation ATPase
VLASAAVALGGYGGGGISRPAPSPAPRPAPTPKVDNSGQIKQVNEAVAANNKAQADLASVTAKLRASFDTLPANAPIVAEFRADQASYNARFAVITEQLKKDPKYQAAVADRNAAQDKLAKLRATTPPPEAEIADATKQLLASIAQVKRLEDQAAASDPQLAPLRVKLASSSEKMADLQKQFDASLASNTEYTAAKSAADAAKQHLDSLRKR